MNYKFYEDNPELHNRTFIETDLDEVYTYSDLKDFSDTIGTLVPARSTVFLVCEGCAGALMGAMSFFRNGIVIFMIDGKLKTQKIMELAESFEPNYLFVPENQAGKFTGFSPLLAQYGMTLLKNEKVQAPPVENKELAILFSTSGTTGSPKFIRISYKNVQISLEHNYCNMHFKPDDVVATVLPLQFIYGFNCILSHVYAGAKIVVTKKSIIQNSFWELCEKKNVTFFYGVPYIFEMICNLGIEERLKRFHTLSVAGGKLKTEVSKKCTAVASKYHLYFYSEYGQTEASGSMGIAVKSKDGSYSPDDNLGTPVNGADFYLVDSQGNKITEPGAEGEVLFECESISMGNALCRPDLNKGYERNGKLRTGDIGVINDEGYICLVGRSNRFVKIYGKRFSLDHIEQTLAERLPGARTAASGRDGLLVVFCGSRESIREISVFLHKEYGLSEENYRVEYLPEIPLNSTGKIAYAELRKIVSERF